ncbi:MAG: hybrid sensor histidine kinase/response regulator [Ignavibacterium sp.]|uniref:hybrid sensor histidine kinase/response regulator transcription factor n=1 Tax=Ignavibacterium sp. TaxID=2651167 RepID=UPI0021DEF1A2|nr:two-component regulator propeller domain-containing protein [Ignavibacterium sp.]BDQ02639.1 MAG: hybrid sensor histidine kinase/response regulator [Ignavibacterium sp.]GIV45285.1 MAG: hybrid sensor histidine kinase/response regulator [Ignavibacterium sp.]
MFGKALLSLLIISLLLKAQSIEFRNYTVQDGLSNNKVNCVLQDRTGFIWFGTEDGLNRFDGHEFKVFKPSSEKNNFISRDIWSIHEDREGNLWIGTKSGDVIKLDFNTQKFSSWIIEEITVNDNSVTAIYVDKKKNVWVGTYQQGLFKFDQNGKKLGHWDYNPENSIGISNNFITSILEDENGIIWISTYYGLNEFNPAEPNKGFKKYFAGSNSINNNLIWELRLSSVDKNKLWICNAGGLNFIDVNSKIINSINLPEEKSIQFSGSVGDVVESIENNREILYIATYGGIIRYDLESKASVRYVQQKDNPKGIISNQVNQMILDKSGVIWIATENGVSSLSLRYNFLLPHILSSQNKLKVLNNDVKSIVRYDKENILVGTSDGLFKVNLKQMKEEEIPQLAGLNIWSLYKDDNDNLWVGTYGQGLFNFNFRTNSLKKILIEYPLFKTLAYNYIKDIKKDREGNLLIATWGGGLVKFINPNSEKYELKFWRSNKNNPEALSFNDVWSVLIDKNRRVWLGTYGGGLNYFDESRNRFVSLNVSNSKNHLKSNSILSIYESTFSSDEENQLTELWLCTDQGLTKLTLKNDVEFNTISDIIVSSKNYTVSDGLTSEVIKSINKDAHNNLWVATSNGIFVYDKRNDRFNPISYLYERKINDYNSGASLNFNDEYFLFGASDGLKIFPAKNISESDFKPNVIISDFQLFNKSFISDENSPVKNSLNNNGIIELSHSQNVFSFVFSSTDYNNPASIKYAYMMKGFDKDWIYADNRRFVTYTNLNPGQYEFLVKATNSEGVWNQEAASIQVIINPPWWRTIWAYFIYIILFLGGILAIRRLELNKAKLLNEIKMKDFEAEKLREVEAMKSRFFANISHELRTPLMLIKGPLDELLNKSSSGFVRELTQLASKNSEKLKTLIDQLLELTQLDSAKIPVKASLNDIVSFSKNVFCSFKSMAEQKNIELVFESDEKELLVWFDNDILEKVLNNLISNAYKFTNTNGKIGLRIHSAADSQKPHLILSVWDNGIGIDDNEIDKIFDRFHQATDSHKKNYSGFGIGLSLIKELVDLHRWKIEVKSKKGEGSEFSLTIPLYDYLDESQKLKEEAQENKIDSNEEIKPVEHPEAVSTSDVQAEKSTIMIVEDSEDVRFFLSTLLKDEYNLILAENGKDAIEKSVEQLPDLIVSDIMMPEMDGLEFCRMIKSDWKTSHIPIILLTARMTIDDKVEGLELGADDYITKPFNSKELRVRIKNLLEQRRKLKERFSTVEEIKTDEYKFSPEENEFIQNAVRIVEENISNIDFDTEKFAEKMFLSRSQLHRKFIQLTNESPGEFIRTIRLKYAAKLLLQKNFNITQIALEVGFNSPSHFSKAFKQFFNCTPKEFIQQKSA